MQLYLAGHEAFGRLTSTRWVRLHHQARSLGTQSLIGTRCQAKKLDRADVMAGTAGARSSLLRSLVWSTTPVDHAGVPGTAARGIQGKSVGRALQKPGWQLLPPLESRSYTRAPYMYEFPAIPVGLRMLLNVGTLSSGKTNRMSPALSIPDSQRENARGAHRYATSQQDWLAYLASPRVRE
jgi:hypothetical protein